MGKRNHVWLAVSGLVVTKDGRWLVVKKRYGGLKGTWSIPAGFVDPGETVDEAVLREVQEETGIAAEVVGVIGIRSGVIREEISDNMIMFLLKPLHEQIVTEEKELYEAAFMHPDELRFDENASVLVRYLLDAKPRPVMEIDKSVNPGDHFGYTAYHLFLQRGN